MAVDVSRFVTPEQDFAGIYKVTDTLDTQKQRQLAQAEQERKDDEVKRGKTAASMRFFTNYLDPKDRYTGTYYDPKMNEYLGEALSQAYELAGKGAGEAEILTAISPLVNKANDYQQKAKVYSENKKQLLTSLKGQKGYNTEALSNLLDKELFEGADIDKVDPFDLVNPLNRIFEKYGDQITNDEAIDDLVKGLPKSKITTDVVTYNSLGGRQRSKAMVDMPNLFIQEEEDGVSKFVPKYDKATDAGEDIVADFVNEKGQTVKAPVRLLEEGAFNDIINSNPAVKHRVEALVNRAIQSGKYTDATGKPITLDSPQARNLGRALMYDMLKQKARVESNVLQETKPAQVRNITNVNVGGGSGGVKGNALDMMKDEDFGNFNVRGGYFYNKDGTPKSGNVFIKGEYLPTPVMSVLKAGGVKPEYLIGGVDAVIENGVIKSISNKLIGTITREAMEGVYQPKMDTERKGENLKFKPTNPQNPQFVFPGGKTKF